MFALNNAYPMFVVKNLKKTVQWYKEKLGFKVTFADYDQAGYVSMQKGDTLLMFHDLKKLDDSAQARKLRDEIKKHKKFGAGVITYFAVKNANRFHTQVSKKGVKTFFPPADQEWGSRTFSVRDPDGYLLTFYHMRPGFDAVVSD